MMNGNDSAYPSNFAPERYNPEFGLTKRELFAARAMQGLLANPGMASDINRGRVAQMAIDQADQLVHYLTIAQEFESQGSGTIAEGLNLLPMYSRELDEGLSNE
jgi:hypothetical protein